MRVANCEIIDNACQADAAGTWHCRLSIRAKAAKLVEVKGSGPHQLASVVAAVSQLCLRPILIEDCQTEQLGDGQFASVVTVKEQGKKQRAGVGRCSGEAQPLSLVVAVLRAASHAGLLKAAYRANNQKVLRGWSRQIVEELTSTLQVSLPLDKRRQLEAEGIVLEHLNRVASAAVVTAANSPQPDSILSLFDTSAWLFDSHGRRRDSYTDTELWLAWYPGLANGELSVDEVVKSMPAAPEAAIPWIVKLFENPTSRFRFRGAVDLEDHDVLHVLLGRGLQDQDEAFVLGFAMGTAKRISWLEYRLFKIVLARLYPEPYRIPHYLQPAFDLGVKCGQATGVCNLYQRQLKELRSLTVAEARRAAGIDVNIVQQYFELEQQQIPFTIASLRLP